MFTSAKCPPGPGLDGTCQLPLGLLYSPFCPNDDDDDEADSTHGTDVPPPLCLTCLSYMNLYVTVVDSTTGLWKCALCGATNAADPQWLQSSSALALVAPQYEFVQPVHDEHEKKDLTHDGDDAATTIVLVVDANLPAAELDGIGRALTDLQSQSQQDERIRWGLVVFDEAVAVYRLAGQGRSDDTDQHLAAADVLVSHEELTDDLLQTKAHLSGGSGGGDDNDSAVALDRVQACLTALAAARRNENNENDNTRRNHTSNTQTTTTTTPDDDKQLSRLERLKRAKAARQGAAAPSSGPVPPATVVPESSPWLKQQKQSTATAFRCTGEALQVAMDLATAAPQRTRTARIWTFTNGYPNLGDGSVVDAASERPNNTIMVDAAALAQALDFYRVLAQTAAEEGLGADVFLCGVAELALQAYQALVEPSAGYALVHETFASSSPHLGHHLRYLWQNTYASFAAPSTTGTPSVRQAAIMDVRFSSFLTPTHFVGPGELIPDGDKALLSHERAAFADGAARAARQRGLKTHNLPSRDMLDTCLTRFRVSRVDPLSTYSLMFRINDFFQKTDRVAMFQCVARYLNRAGTHVMTRVTTHRLPLAKDVGEFLDAVDEEVIPVVLAKEAVYRSMHGREVEGSSPEAPSEEQLEQLAYATQLDLDATVARVSHAYRLLGLQEGGTRRGLDLTEEGGVRAAGSSLDFAFPPELGEALKRLYHLRRGPLLSPGPMRSTDDRLHLRTLFLRFPLEECLLAMAPSLWALTDAAAGPLRPVPAETLALWDSSVIAADNLHTLFIWCGKKAPNVERAKEYCQQFLGTRALQRFPMPDMHLLVDGDSMSRRFTALLSPSHGDPTEHGLAHFPGLSSLPPEELAALQSKFQFYDASTDPSFRSWFWSISSATSNSKDEGWSLCE